jgi:hypothetical protein
MTQLVTAYDRSQKFSDATAPTATPKPLEGGRISSSADKTLTADWILNNAGHLLLALEQHSKFWANSSSAVWNQVTATSGAGNQFRSIPSFIVDQLHGLGLNDALAELAEADMTEVLVEHPDPTMLSTFVSFSNATTPEIFVAPFDGDE